MKFLKFLQCIPLLVYIAVLLPIYPLVVTLIEGKDITFYVLCFTFCTILVLPMIIAEIRGILIMARALIGVLLIMIAISHKALLDYIPVALWVLSLIISIKSKKEQE